MNITVFVKNNCIQCVQTKKILDNHAIAYKTVNVEEDEQAFKYVTETLGFKAAPVVQVIGDDEMSGETWSGFNPEFIQTFILEEKK